MGVGVGGMSREDILGLIEWTGWIMAPAKQFLPETIQKWGGKANSLAALPEVRAVSLRSAPGPSWLKRV